MLRAKVTTLGQTIVGTHRVRPNVLHGPAGVLMFLATHQQVVAGTVFARAARPSSFPWFVQK